MPHDAYFPFGGGPRICIGDHFAQLEAVLVLPTFLQQVELQVMPGFELELEPTITPRPRHGVRMLVRRRGSSSAPARSAA